MPGHSWPWFGAGWAPCLDSLGHGLGAVEHLAWTPLAMGEVQTERKIYSRPDEVKGAKMEICFWFSTVQDYQGEGRSRTFELNI